ncbi:RDD family protein [Kitasatospora sp. NPDC085879]|uniref:RDD family protein n=1 Tax=Kitasatospora sp. NPDC085879 TaxID=3154769 RepID=UPI00344A7B41
MTDRPNGGTADTAVGPMPGYYPDPSIPGFVRYWGGTGWVPGTTRPAPAEGEILEPPRIVSRQVPPLVPPTAAPPPAGPGPSAGPSAGSSAGQPAGPSAGSSGGMAAGTPVPTPEVPSLPDWPSPPPSASETQTGPVYFDETSAGASFVMAAHAEVELRPRADVEPLRVEQPALRPVPPTSVPPVPPVGSVAVPPARSAAPGAEPLVEPVAVAAPAERVLAARAGGSGWQADPLAQHGLLETGSAPRWVSWGVLPAGAEAAPDTVGRAHPAAPPSFPAPAPVRAAQQAHAATAVREAGALSAAPSESSTAEPAAVEPVALEPAAGESTGDEPGALESLAVEGVAAGPVAGGPVPVAEESSAVAGREPAEARPVESNRPDRTVEAKPEVPAPAPEAASSAAPSGRSAPRSAEPPRAAAPADRGRSQRSPAAARPSGPRTVEQPRPGTRTAAPKPPAPRGAEPAASTRRSSEQRPAAARKAVPKPTPPAGLGRRLAARIVDSLAVLVVAAAAGVPLGTAVVAHIREKLDQARTVSALAGHEVRVWLVDGVVLGKVGVLLGVLVVFGLLYEVLPTARTGQTFGKRLARVRVVDARGVAGGRRTPPSFGRSLVRWIVRQAAVLMPVGLLWPLFDRRTRRGWQDRAAATRVVKG